MKFVCWHLLINMLVLSRLSGAENHRPPNVILIISDDQDVYLDGMIPMIYTRQLIGSYGVTFDNAFTTSPLCCPSRASILSGMYSHNHHTTNNSREGGCNDAYWQNKIEPEALAVLLQRKGYETFFAGKYLNEYKGAQIPPGWTWFYGLHGNSRYYNYTLRENAHNITYGNVYLTDLLRQRSLDFINKKATESKPLFMIIAPPAPHQPFTPAKRHCDTFSYVQALKTPNFNKIFDDKHWLVSKAIPLPNTTLNTMDEYFRKRWQSLLAVDELVSALVHRLEELEILNSSYIVYTSDNGYHIGQFAQPFDKRQPYETDIRVPLLMRGPRIAPNTKVLAPVALIDLAPTILQWTSIPAQKRMDGQTLQPFLTNANENDTVTPDKDYLRCLLIQHHGEGNSNTYNSDCPWQRDDFLYGCTQEASCRCQDAWNNTYSCVRHFAYRTNRLYCEFNDNENFIEAYDITSDPFQMHNIVDELLPIEKALYALTLVNLTKCAGTASCSNVII